MGGNKGTGAPSDVVILARRLGGGKRRRTFAHAITPIFWLSLLFAIILPAASQASAWEYWGGDRGGTRFSPLTQITPANVGNLVRAWDFRTGDLAAARRR